MQKRLAVIGTTVAAVAATTLATAPTASADSYNGCAYPRVCFYLTSSDWNSARPTAAYQDVTADFQNLGPHSNGADWVANTRNDDRAYVRYTVNSTGAIEYLCLAPNTHVNFTADYTVTGIRIDTAATC
ncbi:MULTISPECIES: hypothetical protein [Streptomyces]|uniref:Peptidase inhibitor family I36 n=1 Tax=Streptomyces griseiscabiei TaxID=2993540 RepID=A0ABU4L3B4_9ACTN|nr:MULTISPECIES: hypothetical protein [Streptomyces]MBZ3901636.1 hypothetical protein [Streptomyces griseiscabiei]MDX2909810.1 hypothetical protein [Streptomyces griseiscabiei]